MHVYWTGDYTCHYSKKKSKFSSKLTFRAKQNLVNNETDQADNNLLACKLNLITSHILLLCHLVLSSRPLTLERLNRQSKEASFSNYPDNFVIKWLRTDQNFIKNDHLKRFWSSVLWVMAPHASTASCTRILKYKVRVTKNLRFDPMFTWYKIYLSSATTETYFIQKTHSFRTQDQVFVFQDSGWKL